MSFAAETNLVLADVPTADDAVVELRAGLNDGPNEDNGLNYMDTVNLIPPPVVRQFAFSNLDFCNCDDMLTHYTGKKNDAGRNNILYTEQL